jgi:DNA polymerase-3 subunit alpha (Gram-positive type)
MNKNFLDKIYLSIETSGLTPIDFKIIEIAALKIDEFNNKSLFHKLINPQKELGEEVTKLTLISNEDLKNQKNFDQIKDQLISFLGKTKIVVNHNKFIKGFLNKEIGNNISNEFIDINELFNQKFPNESSSFNSILEKFELKINTNFSQTLNEVLILPNIYQKLLD